MVIDNLNINQIIFGLWKDRNYIKPEVNNHKRGRVMVYETWKKVIGVMIKDTLIKY